MQRAMAKQAEAERKKRAKVLHAQGELQASQQLTQAAGVLSMQSAAIQLRYLQTVTEIAVEKNSTLIFPLPIDLIKSMMRHPAQITERETQPMIDSPAEQYSEKMNNMR